MAQALHLTAEVYKQELLNCLGRMIPSNAVNVTKSLRRIGDNNFSRYTERCFLSETRGLDFFFFFMPGFYFLDEKKNSNPDWRSRWRRVNYAGDYCKLMIEKICEHTSLYAGEKQVVIFTNQYPEINERIFGEVGNEKIWIATEYGFGPKPNRLPRNQYTPTQFSGSLGVMPFEFEGSNFYKSFGSETENGKIIRALPSDWRPFHDRL